MRLGLRGRPKGLDAIPSPPPPVLPRRGERFPAYAARVTPLHFQWILSAWDLVSLRARRWAGPVLRSLMARRGEPLHAELGAFVGTRSALGLHFDLVDVFMFVLAGRKQVHLWPPGEARPTGRAPMVLEGRPGALVAWPRGYWHRVHTEGVSLSLNLAVAWSPGTTYASRRTSPGGVTWRT